MKRHYKTTTTPPLVFHRGDVSEITKAVAELRKRMPADFSPWRRRAVKPEAKP